MQHPFCKFTKEMLIAILSYLFVYSWSWVYARLFIINTYFCSILVGRANFLEMMCVAIILAQFRDKRFTN